MHSTDNSSTKAQQGQLFHHLKLLKGADLIMEYKEKNFIYYEINTSVFEELILWIRQFGGDKS